MEDDKINVVIAYGDGSAWPNPGYYGSGVHGYIYDVDAIGSKSGDIPPHNIISTEGYIERALITPITEYKTVLPHTYFNLSHGYKGIGTNNMGEVLALINTINTLHEKSIPFTELKFMTDSTYVLTIVKHIQEDKERTWYRQDRVNISLWLELELLLKDLDTRKITLSMRKVKGHSTELGNHLADRLAYLARYQTSMESTKDFVCADFRTSAKYWKPKFDKHPLLGFNQLFFTNGDAKKHLDRYKYAVMDYSKDIEKGKMSNEVMFGAVLLKEPLPLVDEVMDAYNDFTKILSTVSMVNLTNIYKQKHMLLADIFGDLIYDYNPRNRMMRCVEEDVIANTVFPPGLANNSLKNTNKLFDVLDEYTNNKELSKNRVFKDITDVFFDKESKKNSLKFKLGVKVFDVTYTYKDIERKLPLVGKRDILDRNHLKKLEKLNPKITLVLTEVKDNFVEYHIIIETTDDIACYCNFYVNRIYFKS